MLKKINFVLLLGIATCLAFVSGCDDGDGDNADGITRMCRKIAVCEGGASEDEIAECVSETQRDLVGEFPEQCFPLMDDYFGCIAKLSCDAISDISEGDVELVISSCPKELERADSCVGHDEITEE